MKKVMAILLVLIILISGCAKEIIEEPEKAPVEQPRKCVDEGEFCGGIAGIICCEGMTCKLDGNYPDAGGRCISGLGGKTKQENLQ